MNVAHLLIGQAKEHSTADAIIEGRGKRITFAGLSEQSARCTMLLREAGIGVGDHVLVFVPMSIDLYLALIAIFQLGAMAVFLDPSAGAEHINRCCEMIAPRALIAISKAHLLRLKSKALRAIPLKFSIGLPVPGASRWEQAWHCAPLNEIEPRGGDAAALVTFTSGSTGLPKAAVRSHGFLAAQHASLQRAIELTPGEVDLATLPIFTLANMASGVTSVIPDADLRSVGSIKPAPVLKQIVEHQVTRCVASPAFFRQLLDGNNTSGALKQLMRAYTGGAPVYPDLLSRMQSAMPGAKVMALYGSTEAEPIAEIAQSDISLDDITAMSGGAGLLAGQVVPDIDLRIVPNRFGQPLPPTTRQQMETMVLPPKEIGEIIVHGDHVLRGYLNGRGDAQTKWRVDDQIWHRTGDAGYLDERGRLWLLGRAEAKIEDEHGTVYPFSVECAARSAAVDSGGIAQAALVALANRRVLVIQPLRHASEELNRKLRDALAWAKIHEIRIMDKIPLDKRHNAKIDYPALRKRLKGG